jgi:hypothetical protein
MSGDVPAVEDEGPTMNDAHEKAELFLQHPDECPEIIGPLDYLIHPPSKLGATAAWISFRDRTLLPMLRHKPDDPNLPNFLKQVELILAWRATIPPEKRFWKSDEAYNARVTRMGGTI